MGRKNKVFNRTKKAMRKDIDLGFKKHPLTGDLVLKTGPAAIRQSLINIVRTNFYDRGFNVEVGTNTDFHLFENASMVTTNHLKLNITNSIKNFEPDVELVDVKVFDNKIDENTIVVKIYYVPLNSATTEELSISLERIR